MRVKVSHPSHLAVPGTIWGGFVLCQLSWAGTPFLRIPLHSSRLAWPITVQRERDVEAEMKLQHFFLLFSFARKVDSGHLVLLQLAPFDAHWLAPFVGQQPSHSNFSSHRMSSFSNSSTWPGAHLTPWQKAVCRLEGVKKPIRFQLILAAPSLSSLLTSHSSRLLKCLLAGFGMETRCRNDSLTLTS